MNPTDRKGFTLVELLITLAIIGLMSALVVLAMSVAAVASSHGGWYPSDEGATYSGGVVTLDNTQRGTEYAITAEGPSVKTPPGTTV